MKLFVGTSGYSYKEWVGRFYPEKTRPAEMLKFYAEHFNTVELNNTFYRAPNEKNLQQWSADVGKNFCFSLKASKRITHMSRLKESAFETVEYIYKTQQVLKKKEGPTLFQLPPNFKADEERLSEFLKKLPAKRPAAFEFRNLSWFNENIYALLNKHNLALCYSDGEVDDEPFKATADWGYVRLRRVEYDSRQLQDWVDRLKAQSWQKLFVYFKHEDEATGPKLATRFLELWN